MILLSAGFDSTVLGGAQGQEAAEAAQAAAEGRLWEVQSDRYFGDSVTRDSLDRLFRALAATDTVIHTVDVGGLAAAGAVDQAVPGRLAPGRDTLAQFAANTGGRFIKDANDLRGGLVELLDASSHYYVLAFEPLEARGKPGRLRKLEVRVRAAGSRSPTERGTSSRIRSGTPCPEPDSSRPRRRSPRGSRAGRSPCAPSPCPTATPRAGSRCPWSWRSTDGRCSGAGPRSSCSSRCSATHSTARDASTTPWAWRAPSTWGSSGRSSRPRGSRCSPPSRCGGSGGPALRGAEKHDGPRGVAAGAAGRAGLRGREDPSLAAARDGRPADAPGAARRLARPPGLAIPFRLADTPFTVAPLPVLRNGAERDVA